MQNSKAHTVLAILIFLFGCSSDDKKSTKLADTPQLTSLDEPKSWTRNRFDQTTRDEIDRNIRAEKLYNELRTLLGSDRLEGSCRVGSVRGSAILTLGPKGVGVTYQALQYSAIESGYLENFKITRNEQGKNILIADWIPSGSGSGILAMETFEEHGANLVYVGISGSSFSYFDNVELPKEKFETFKKSLENFK